MALPEAKRVTGFVRPPSPKENKERLVRGDDEAHTRKSITRLIYGELKTLLQQFHNIEGYPHAYIISVDGC